MSKKRLNEAGIVNELRGNSVFFESPPPSEEAKQDLARGSLVTPEGLERAKTTYHTPEGGDSPEISSPEVSKGSETNKEEKEEIKVSRYHDTKLSRNHDSKTPRHREGEASSAPDILIETIRKAVKQLGKEVSTHRFTPEEKKLLRDIVYTYETRGVKTSENEITRIAIHSLVADYRENNENSLLARVLERLNG